MVTDANGDIYLVASGLAFGDAAGDKPAGVLKIKAGETDFDEDYFFNLTEAIGEETCFGLTYVDNGLAFTIVSEDDSNYFGFDGANPVFRYRKIDIYNKTDLGDLAANLPNTHAERKGSVRQRVSDDELILSIASANEDALYSYKISTGEASKKITSTGGNFTGLIILE